MSNQPADHSEQADSFGPAGVILPCQFFGSMGGKSLCAEQRLMLAVLVDAINVLQGWNRLNNARNRHAFAEAGQWVTTRGCGYPFSFDSVCDALNIDAEKLRQGLARLVMGLGLQNGQGATHGLRLNESGRVQSMSANRVRQRDRRASPPAVSKLDSPVSATPTLAMDARRLTGHLLAGLEACERLPAHGKAPVGF